MLHSYLARIHRARDTPSPASDAHSRSGRSGRRRIIDLTHFFIHMLLLGDDVIAIALEVLSARIEVDGRLDRRFGMIPGAR